MNVLDQTRDALKAGGIKYYVKTVNRRSPSPFSAGSRGHTGTAFEKMEYEYTYYLYVHKNDYNTAVEIIRGER
jgi:hypothetical protein